MKSLYVIIYLLLGLIYVESMLIPAYTGRVCPGIQTFTCEMMGDTLFWTFVNGSNLANLRIAPQVNLPTGPVTVSPNVSVMLNASFNMGSNTVSSSLTVVLDGSLNGVLLRCEDFLGRFAQNSSLDVVVPSSLPVNITLFDQQSSTSSVNVTLRWNPPMNSGGTNETSYFVTVSPPAKLSDIAVISPSITVIDADYNVNYTISIVATNCAGNSSGSKEYTFRVALCTTSFSMNTSGARIDSIPTIATVGSILRLICTYGGVMDLTFPICGSDGRWSPDPETFNCSAVFGTDTTTMCEVPSEPLSGSLSVSGLSSYEVGSIITYRCDDGLYPLDIMRSTCTSVAGRGIWVPDPAQLKCLNLANQGTSVCSTEVAVSVAVTFILSVCIGLAVGVCSTYLMMRNKTHTSSTETTITTPQQSPPPSPEYEDVLQLQEEIELKTNSAYGPVAH